MFIPLPRLAGPADIRTAARAGIRVTVVVMLSLLAPGLISFMLIRLRGLA